MDSQSQSGVQSPPQGNVTANFEGQSAGGYARQHVGNVYNHNTYTYSPRKRHTDETLRSDGRSAALLKAAAEGQTARVSYLIRLGVDIDHSDDNAFTALHHAALSGFEDTVEVLLAAGCDVNAASFDFGTPLHLAASKARGDVVQRLLGYRADVNAPSRLLASPLHCACLAASYAIASALIKNGADLRKQSVLLCHALRDLESNSSEKRTLNECEPLHCAAEGGDVALVQLLLEQGVPIDTGLRYWRATLSDISSFENVDDPRKFSGITALKVAAMEGRADVCRLLLRQGADVEAEDSRHSSILYSAAGCEYAACIEALLEAKAPVDSLNNDRETALHNAAQWGYTACMKALIDANASLDLQNCHGHTALHYAARWGHTSCTEALAKAKASLDSLDERGDTALSLAAYRGQTGCVRLLLELNAKFDIPNTYGWTPLHHAADEGHVEITRLLLASGADVNARETRFQRTPLHLAEGRKRLDIVRLLLRSGSDQGMRPRNIGQLLLASGSTMHAGTVPTENFSARVNYPDIEDAVTQTGHSRLRLRNVFNRAFKALTRSSPDPKDVP